MGHDRRLDTPKRALVPSPGPRGRLELVGPDAGRVQLAPGPGGLRGALTVRNGGDGPLQIFRVGVLVDEGEARAPSGLGVLAPDRSATPLAPGETRTYTITWRSLESPVEQVEGYVAIESDSAAPTATTLDPPRVVGVEADRRPTWRRRLLSAMVLLPLALPLLALATRTARALDERRLRLLGLGVAGVHLALAATALAWFARSLSFADGNEGLQHVERVALAGDLEWWWGVDGVGVALLPALSAAVFAAFAALPSAARPTRLVVGLGGALLTAATAAVAAQNLLFSTAALLAVALGGAALRALATTPEAEGGSRKIPILALGVLPAIAAVAFGVLGHLLARTADEGLRADGTPSQLVTSIPELARAFEHGHLRADAAARGVLGLPADEGLFVLALVGALALVFALPRAAVPQLRAQHDASTDAADTIARAAAMVAGMSALFRFGVAMFPHAAHHGAVALFALGTIALAGAGLAACTTARATAAVELQSLAIAGAAVAAIGTLTPQGLMGGLTLAITAIVAAPLATSAVRALSLRTGHDELARLRGVGATAPKLAIALVLGTASLTAWPGAGGTWGALLGVWGAAGRSPLLALALTAGLAVLGFSALRLARVVGGEPPPDAATNPSLEPFAGRLPDLRPRELAGPVVLALALVALAVAHRHWPGAMGQRLLDLLEHLDPPGPTQVAIECGARPSKVRLAERTPHARGTLDGTFHDG
jgi:NADH:ubiquinone oxidoreductase subunit 4 (subunit M)